MCIQFGINFTGRQSRPMCDYCTVTFPVQTTMSSTLNLLSCQGLELVVVNITTFPATVEPL